MTSPPPSSNLLVRLISHKVRQLLGQSADPYDTDKIGTTSDKVGMPSVSVHVPPPSLDVNPARFSQGEAFVNQTIDDILSDEMTFDKSFDEYSAVDQVSDGYGHAQSESGSAPSDVDDSDAENPSERSLPYSSPCPSHKRQKLQHTRSPNSRSTSAESGGESQQDAASSVADLSSEESPEKADNEAGGNEERPGEDDLILGSLSFDRREQLLRFIQRHPFIEMQPIRRTARRQFLRDIRGEATKVGLDEEKITLLERHVRNLYLEIRNIDADSDGSEFGPELDDAYEPLGGTKIKKRKSEVALKPSSKSRKIKRGLSTEYCLGHPDSGSDVDREAEAHSVDDSAISVSEENSTVTLSRAHPRKISPLPRNRSDVDEGISEARAEEKTPSAADLAVTVPDKRSSQVASEPNSHPVPPKEVVVIDLSSSGASQTDPVPDTASSNSDKKQRRREKRQRRALRKAKRDENLREALATEGTTSGESQPKDHLLKKKAAKDKKKTKKNRAADNKSVDSYDQYWSLKDF
ncbi:hypothetical protein BDV59DRAFT_29035 [Aspergillus ambiguus]|uniref:uncharacterized protein n=1 Tax=Aspergillus ambiguus TaxID=176160 RepID=UPI003CCD6669